MNKREGDRYRSRKTEKILGQKAGTYLWGRDHAFFFFPKPLVAIFGNKIINGIADGFGHDGKYPQETPETSEMLEGL